MSSSASRSFPDWLSSMSSPRAGYRSGRRISEIPDVLATGELRVAFQPLVTLRTMEIYAYEALVRSTSPHFKHPGQLIDAAIAHDYIGPLGRIIRELAVAGCPDHPLFLNIHPTEFDHSWLVQPDDPMFRHDHPVYLEITEQVPLERFDHCHGVLREIRHKGARLAVDDLGAGYSNLKYIADLQPEVVKLDRGLVSDLRIETRLHRLVMHIVRMCEDLGARVVAEGIETAEEARAVIEAGVHYGQGYFFARPGFHPPGVSEEAMRVRRMSRLPFPMRGAD